MLGVVHISKGCGIRGGDCVGCGTCKGRGLGGACSVRGLVHVSRGYGLCGVWNMEGCGL